MNMQNQRASLLEQNPVTLVNQNLIQHKKHKSIKDELKLISVCQEIGAIAEQNKQYTLMLTLHINQPIESLTVNELLSFHRETVQRFNQEVQS
jgi:hypothetical protein